MVSQSRSHFLRQVMMRPQVMQGLEGRVGTVANSLRDQPKIQAVIRPISGLRVQ